MNGKIAKELLSVAKELMAQEDRARRSKYRNYLMVRIEGAGKQTKTDGRGVKQMYKGAYKKLFKVLNEQELEPIFGDTFDSYWDEEHWIEGDDLIVVVSDSDGKPIEPPDDGEIERIPKITIEQKARA